MREFFNDVNVRKGLNVAIDRDTINRSSGRPDDAAPGQPSPWPTISGGPQAYAYYDPDEANVFLEGWPHGAGRFFRLWKDGSGAVFSSSRASRPRARRIATRRLLVDYFGAVGVSCTHTS